MDFCDNNKVGKVVHLIAQDEYRYNVEATSIFTSYKKDTDYRNEENFCEYSLTGVHSDLGGGYATNNDDLVLLYTGSASFFKDAQVLN